MIDAYLHAGGPRFGSAALALRELERWDIDRGIIVLPPFFPDFACLEKARQAAGDKVRLVGVPFGESETQRAELADWQVAFGVTGLRLMPFEMDANAAAINRFGEAGRWLFAINPYDSTPMQRTLLHWLETHPQGRIACPHFFKPAAMEEVVEDAGLFRELLRHPRFFVIFSRHGKTGTQRPYPHEDLKPWVDDVLAEAGWEKIMWGSEYPVLYWRDEQIPEAAEWLRALLGEVDEANYARYLHGNAHREFFESPAPKNQAGPPPAWVASQMGAEGAAVPFPQNPVKLPPEAAERFMRAYLETNQPGQAIKLSDFAAQVIERGLRD